MAVISTNVGPGQTTTTFAAWMTTLPGNIVTSGNSYVCNVIGKLTDVIQNLTGHTTDTTHTLTITAPAGQSFVDNANKLTNALAYNSANGSSWESVNGYAAMLMISDANVTISRMQFKSTGATQFCLFWNNQANGRLSNCIVQTTQRNGNDVVLFDTSGGVASNCLLVSMTSNANGMRIDRSATAVNITIVRPSDIGSGGGGLGASANYGTSTLRNSAVFGFGSATATNFAADGHNCTDLATTAGSTANLVSKTYANQFINTVSTTQDWRLKTGADCIDAGVTDATNVPSAADIVGTTRPSGASWDIGAWEFASAAPGYRARVVRWG